jgi:organic radical activating enzyme
MELTLEITNYCPNECEYCSTWASRKGYYKLSKREINEFLNKFDQGKITRINISGGEPLSHPDFYEILSLCKAYTKNVWVYTNAVPQIMYNTDIVKEIKVEANVCLVPGKKVYIPKDASKVHLLQLVKQGRASNMDPANITASGNIPRNECMCEECDHIVFQADRKVVGPPCKKTYE